MTDTTIGASGPSGIGGWLVLPLFILVMTPLRTIIDFVTMLPEIDAIQTLLPEDQFFEYVRLGVLAMVLVVMPLLLLLMMRMKKRGFPNAFCLWAFIAVVITLAFLALDRMSPTGAFDLTMDREAIRALVSSGVILLVWVPYMKLSRRVRNTFVNP